MTIAQLRIRALELEAEADARLRVASKEFQEVRHKPRTPEWIKASDKLIFWRDTRNGFRMAADALLGLSMIEEGGDWN